MPASLSDLLPYGPEVTSDTLLDRFLDYVTDRGLALYPAQEEAILALLDGQNVVLNTPTPGPTPMQNWQVWWDLFFSE